jgi:hypothetical protein
MKKAVIVLLLLAFSAVMAQAQTDAYVSTGYKMQSYYTFSWNNVFPVGDFHKWVSQPSAAGFDIGGRYLMMGGLMFGFNISWQRVSKEYAQQTFTIPDKGIALTATNYRFTWMVPFQGVVGYHFLPAKMLSPYVSLGIGGDYMEHHLLIQEYDLYKSPWDFSLTPEVGVLAKFGDSGWGAMLAFNYKFTTNKIEIYETTSKNLQMMDLKIGLAYIIH